MNEDEIIGIEQIERGVFLVPSHKFPNVKYRCDITANNGATHCICKDFAIKRQPRIDAGETPITDRTVCKHIKDLIFAIARRDFKRMSEQENEAS